MTILGFVGLFFGGVILGYSCYELQNALWSFHKVPTRWKRMEFIASVKFFFSKRTEDDNLGLYPLFDAFVSLLMLSGLALLFYNFGLPFNHWNLPVIIVTVGLGYILHLPSVEKWSSDNDKVSSSPTEHQ